MMENTERGPSQHLMLIRNIEWDKNLSPDQLQGALTRFMDWVKTMDDAGILAGAQPLAFSGKVVSGKGGAQIADGPFAETKEAVGGYFLLNVADLDKAVEWAQKCPALEYGCQVEVREVIEKCAMQQRLDSMRTVGAAQG